MREPAAPRDAGAVLDEPSRTLLARALNSGAAALTRCSAAHAHQFPDLAQPADEAGWMHGVRAVAGLFKTMVEQGLVAVDDAAIAADRFLNLVLGRRSKQTLYGIAVESEVLEKRRRAAVKLVLAGTRPPPG